MLKSPDAFRTISEVAEDLDLPQHVLRFWETRFAQIRPLKRAGGRRYYRPADVLLLRSIRQLLYDEGYTIKGVQRLLKDQGAKSLRTGEQPVLVETFMAADLGGIGAEGDEAAGAPDAFREAGSADDPLAATDVQAADPEQTIYDDMRTGDGEEATRAGESFSAERPVQWSAKDRAALHEALSLVEECAEILRAARQQRS